MKLIRLQIPGNFLDHLGFPHLFEKLEFVEILNAFQYDQTHFFALQKIRFKEDFNMNLNKFIQQNFNPESFQLLAQASNEIICIMNQTRSSGFFPIIDSGPWAFIFPIHVSRAVVLINIISQENYLDKLFKILSSFTENYEIMGLTDLNNINQIDEALWKMSLPFPKFTKRQQEIAIYAAKKGFFKSPKKISSHDIANHFGISESATNKNLKKASNLAMEYFFGKYF